MGGALVVILSVSDHRREAFADQSLCDVTGGRGRRRDYLNNYNKQTLPASLPPSPASEQILSELAQQKENMDVEDSQGGFAEGQRSEIC